MLVSNIDILTDLSTTLYTQHPVGPLYHHASPVLSPVYSLTWFDTSTSGDSALREQTLPLYSETNARVTPVEAYALLSQATRDMSGLIVPRTGLLSLARTPMESWLTCANPCWSLT